MKKFIIQTLALVSLVGLSFLWVVSQSDGYTDPFYLRFTTGPQGSLILGNSRSAQGLQPSEFDNILGADIFNYSFTVGQSPYGPTYFRSIKLKLDSSEQNGIYILTVDPWSISSRTEPPNDSANFQEKDLILGKTTDVTSDPNFSYLFNNLGGGYYKALRSLLPKKPKMVLHKDGWLEVSISMDSTDVANRIERKNQEFRNRYLSNYSYSSLRVKYLCKTIRHLRNHGKVYLVRLPIHPSIMALENEFMSDFNNHINSAIQISDGYLDFSPQNEKFTYTDGSHLHKTSGRTVSQLTANWIRELEETQQ